MSIVMANICHLLSSQSSIADGPDMLFFINTTATSVGEKLRTLVGLPSASLLNKPTPDHVHAHHTHTHGITYDGITGRVRGSHEEKKGRGFCTEAACRINEDAEMKKKVGSEDETGKGDKKDAQHDVKGESKTIEKSGNGKLKLTAGEHLDDASHVTLESDGDDILDMFLVILDVPEGGDFYKYPCHSANLILSHIPSFMHSTINVEVAATATGKIVDNMESAKKCAEKVDEGQMHQSQPVESEQVAEKKESEQIIKEGTDQNDIVSSITGADISIGSLEVLTDSSSVAGSASTITTHETLKGKGKFNAQFPQITVSNIDQITRKFISDYQMNELMKYVYALKRHMYKLIKLKCTLYSLYY